MPFMKNHLAVHFKKELLALNGRLTRSCSLCHKEYRGAGAPRSLLGHLAYRHKLLQKVAPNYAQFYPQSLTPLSSEEQSSVEAGTVEDIATNLCDVGDRDTITYIENATEVDKRENVESAQEARDDASDHQPKPKKPTKRKSVEIPPAETVPAKYRSFYEKVFKVTLQKKVIRHPEKK